MESEYFSFNRRSEWARGRMRGKSSYVMFPFARSRHNFVQPNADVNLFRFKIICLFKWLCNWLICMPLERLPEMRICRAVSEFHMHCTAHTHTPSIKCWAFAFLSALAWKRAEKRAKKCDIASRTAFYGSLISVYLQKLVDCIGAKEIEITTSLMASDSCGIFQRKTSQIASCM